MNSRLPEPPDPDFADRIRDSFSRQPYMNLIGARVERVAPGECDVAIGVRDDLCQQHGYVHGAVIGAISDDAAAYAAYTLMPADATVLAVEYKLNFLAPAGGDELLARGRVVRIGRTLATAQVEVVARTGDSEHLVAVALSTIIRLSGVPDRPRQAA